MVCAVSCSKNFGLYRERTGALHIINSSVQAGDAALSQLVRLARGMWSMPPDHGAEIVRRILADADLREAWARELEAMRVRISALRHELVRQLRAHCPQRDFSFIATQRGMFSFFGITTEQVRRMRGEHHIYMTDDSRINIAGLRAENLEYVAQRDRAGAQGLGALGHHDAVRGLDLLHDEVGMGLSARRAPRRCGRPGSGGSSPCPSRAPSAGSQSPRRPCDTP